MQSLLGHCFVKCVSDTFLLQGWAPRVIISILNASFQYDVIRPQWIFFRFPGCKFAYPEKKTPGSKWVVWLSASAKNCDRPCEKKRKGDPNAENSILQISASFIKITETKLSFTRCIYVLESLLKSCWELMSWKK